MLPLYKSGRFIVVIYINIHKVDDGELGRTSIEQIRVIGEIDEPERSLSAVLPC